MWDGGLDAVIDTIEYEPGEYNTQIHVVLHPPEYEFEVRGMEYDEDADEGWPQQWYSMGGKADTFQVSEDGYDLVGNPPNITKQCRAFKFIMGIREHMEGKLSGTNLESLEGQSFHFEPEIEKGTNRETKQPWERAVLYATGPAVGEPTFGSSSEGSREEKRAARKKKKGGAAVAEAPEETEAEAPEQPEASAEGAPKKKKKRKKGGGEASSNGAGDPAAAQALLVQIVTEEEDGIAVRAVAQKAMEKAEDVGEPTAALAVAQSTIDAAKEAELITEEDGKLYALEDE